jgi:hypothetical protein
MMSLFRIALTAIFILNGIHFELRSCCNEVLYKNKYSKSPTKSRNEDFSPVPLSYEKIEEHEIVAAVLAGRINEAKRMLHQQIFPHNCDFSQEKNLTPVYRFKQITHKILKSKVVAPEKLAKLYHGFFFDLSGTVVELTENLSANSEAIVYVNKDGAVGCDLIDMVVSCKIYSPKGVVPGVLFFFDEKSKQVPKIAEEGYYSRFSAVDYEIGVALLDPFSSKAVLRHEDPLFAFNYLMSSYLSGQEIFNLLKKMINRGITKDEIIKRVKTLLSAQWQVRNNSILEFLLLLSAYITKSYRESLQIHAAIVKLVPDLQNSSSV